tara:strand:+ start:947 stop:1060 length:114 start_codon:yes stop_codon:yes gene_type:complete
MKLKVVVTALELMVWLEVQVAFAMGQIDCGWTLFAAW